MDKKMQWNVIISWAVTIIVIIASIVISKYNYSKDAEYDAVTKAKIITAQVRAEREIYTGYVVKKLEDDGTGAHQDSKGHQGYVMLPAQVARLISQNVSRTNDLNYSYQLISEWNINTEQGLNEAFDIWAWQRLRQQEDEFKVRNIKPKKSGYPWEAVYRIEENEGRKVLRYMDADPASAMSCVVCHNKLEMSADIIQRRKVLGEEVGKRWKMHDLMGAVSVTFPLEE